MPSLKEKVGCWLHERWRTEVVLSPMLSRLTGWYWVDLCNRHERLTRVKPGARVCEWEDSSFLTVARFFPRVGGRLLRHCLTEWPIHFLENPAGHSSPVLPEISVILPVGGRARVPLFLAVLGAFKGQRGCGVEIIVVEHALKPEYESFCPMDVNYFFLPMEPTEQFNKSLAMNKAVGRASAPLVLLHDADLVPPATYVENLLIRFRQGWEVVRPVRFTFHLEQDDSERFLATKGAILPKRVGMVQQNNPGLSTAITRKAYEQIGGHDESFEGWGGEDLEFLDRLKTLKLYPGGYAPLVHLWHLPGGKKASGDRNRKLMEEIRTVPVMERIQALRSHR